MLETDNKVRYSRALVKEYQTSKRQFAFYILDCQRLTKMFEACNSRDLAAFQRHFNAEHGDQMYVGVMLENRMATEEMILSEIERLLKKEFEPHTLQPKDKDKQNMSHMFSKNLTVFDDYLKNEFAPKIMFLQQIFYKYTFESPLNFIMIKSDFKRFFESFTQARLSLLYSLEMHKDAIFTLDPERQQRQLDLSKILFKYFQEETNEMRSILDEYHHLLEHDNIKCSANNLDLIDFQNFKMICWFRRYGFPIITLGLFFVLSALSLYKDYSRLKTKKVGMD